MNITTFFLLLYHIKYTGLRKVSEPQEEEGEMYEAVEYGKDSTTIGETRVPMPLPYRDPADRPAMALPKSNSALAVEESPEVYEVSLTDAAEMMSTNPAGHRPPMHLPGKEKTNIVEDEVYEDVNTDDTPVTGRTAFEDKDVYQNTPIGPQSKAGRYRNLPAEPHQVTAGKGGGYTKWSGPRK